VDGIARFKFGVTFFTVGFNPFGGGFSCDGNLGFEWAGSLYVFYNNLRSLLNGHDGLLGETSGATEGKHGGGSSWMPLPSSRASLSFNFFQ
jgi:hypothetical protein